MGPRGEEQAKASAQPGNYSRPHSIKRAFGGILPTPSGNAVTMP